MSPRASLPARAPVLYPAPLPDAEAARQRLSADAGRLVLHRGGAAEVLADAGAIRAAHLVTGGTRVGRGRLHAELLPWVVLEISAAAPVALPLGGWVPAALSTAGHRLGADGVIDLLAVSGIRPLLAAVGVADADVFDLDEPRPEALRALRSPRLVDPRAGPADLAGLLLVLRALGVGSVLALAAHGIVRGLVDGEFRPDLPWPPMALVVATAAAVLALAAWRRRSVAGRPTRRGDLAPGAVEQIGLGDGRVVVGRDESGDLMVDDGGLVSWLPGPARGGATQALALAARGETRLVMVTTADGVVLADLPGADAATTARLRALLTGCGVEWAEHRTPRDAPGVAPRGHPSAGPVDDQWPEFCLLVAVLAGLTGLLAAGNGLWLVVTAAAAVVGAALVARRMRRP